MTAQRITGTCALCLRQKPLCASHVIPEFCYRPTYDAKHRARLMESTRMAERLVQKGIREYLLCSDCEQKINEYETYFKTFWFDMKALPDKVAQQVVTVSAIDYDRFRLFHLSVLWRSGVAQAMPFGNVSLGPHADQLRQQIMNSDPGPEGSYPFWGTIILNPDSTVCYDLISGPYAADVDSLTAYYMCYAGCEWTFVVTDSTSSKYSDLSIKRGVPLQFVAFPAQQINTVRVFAEQRKNAAF
jgi:hypothetical protein